MKLQGEPVYGTAIIGGEEKSQGKGHPNLLRDILPKCAAPSDASALFTSSPLYSLQAAQEVV
jgi:hypothetical protein